jgi:3-phenylpropionate/trans-cinnamate dioxygenase ferredoxin reductase subunit
MTDPIVVVGAGLAGAKAVEAARAGGYDGPLVMYGEEPHRPYERPPLSKGYLTGDTELDGAYVHEAGWYHEHGVELRLGTPVTDLDAGSHELSAGGRTQRYSRLLLTTGSTPRRLGLADDSGAPVTYLRTIEDSDRIKSLFAADGRLVVVGGGWIGLEVAAAARAAGMEVTVIEAMELPLLRVLGAEVARSFLDLHREHGVDMRMAATVAAVQRKGRPGGRPAGRRVRRRGAAARRGRRHHPEHASRRTCRVGPRQRDRRRRAAADQRPRRARRR